MKQLLETLDLALAALEESVDLVREDYENAKKLYSNYPSRQARLIGLEDGLSKHEAAITAIKQARSAPVQEPVAWVNAEKRTFEWNGPVLWNTPTVAVLNKIPLYTTPPAAQRQWVGLTDREMVDAIQHLYQGWAIAELAAKVSMDDFRAIEAKLKEKNT